MKKTKKYTPKIIFGVDFEKWWTTIEDKRVLETLRNLPGELLAAHARLSKIRRSEDNK
jgi:hypothetical protein